jgi:DNA-binding transcriptional LysR family regulator
LAKDLDWDDLRLVLEVKGAGSANAAALKMKTSHTTILRRLKNLEAVLNVPITLSTQNGARLTTEGEVLAKAAEKMQHELSDCLEFLAETSDVSGEVRINITQGLGAYWLSPRLLEWQQIYPNLTLTYQSMTPRYLKVGTETDISFLWKNPDDQNVTARKLGEVDFSLFIGEKYAARHGIPKTLEDLCGLELLHFVAHDVNPAFKVWRSMISGRVKLIRMENHVIVDSIIRGGNFLALLPNYVANVFSGLLRTPIETEVTLPLWLTYQAGTRGTKRVRVVVQEILRLAAEAKNPLQQEGSWLR